MSDRPHGYARYKLDSCRCYVCGYAVAQYNDAREHAIRRGEWQPYVDAEPVRQHLQALRDCGMGLRRVADVADVDRKRLQAVLSGRPERGTGPQEKIRPELAAAVLAVQPTIENLAPATLVNATGTRRRLQALVRAGWPQHHLAVRLGMTDSNFGTCMRRDQVTVRVARAVRVVFTELERTPPQDNGVNAQAFSRARNHGEKNGWALPLAWDEDAIDDPAAFPDWTGQCGTSTGYTAHFRLRILPTCQPCRDAWQEHKLERQATAAA